MDKESSIVARAPATVANVGPGFDVLGFALSDPAVTVELAFGDAEGKGILIEADIPTIPTFPTMNTAGAAVQALQAHSGKGDDLVMKITAGVPIGSGLGSSAASAVAAVVAANKLLGTDLSADELLPFAVAGESVSSGSPHADNVAPALFGGMTLVRSNEPADVVALPIPDDLYYVVVHPHCEVKTADARRVLPDTIALDAAVTQWAQLGAFVAGLFRGDYELIGRAMSEELLEPLRGKFIPGFAAVKQAALQAGALGCTVSGSGPSMLAFTKGAADAAKVCHAMQQAFTAAEVVTDSWVGTLIAPGASVVSS